MILKEDSINGKFRKEKDSLGEVEVSENKLWGAQTQRALEYFNIGELMPKEMIKSYAVIKKAAARVNSRVSGLSNENRDLIEEVCEEIIQGKHDDEFPTHIWISGSGTQFNMNMNEVISNRCSQLAGMELGSKIPVHPNNHVNMSQSTNDTFPSAMSISCAVEISERLLPELKRLQKSLENKSTEWKNIKKIGRTHMQDAVPMTLGQEFSGYAVMIEDSIARLEYSLEGVYKLCLGGTAIGTGINAPENFGREAAKEIAQMTGLPFISGKNKFALQGSHDDMVHLSSALKTIANSLFKIANDIRVLSSGPRCGIGELILPENEPGSSIMPGKINPTQCEALSMIALQVIANDTAVTLGGAGGVLEMNVYKPLIISNLLNSIKLLTQGCYNFRRFMLEEMKPNLKVIKKHFENSLMLVTALNNVIGYDKASKIALYAMEEEISLKEAALKLGFIEEEVFDKIIGSL